MTSPERFHLTLSTAGRTVIHGWWTTEATAHSKYRNWIDTYSTLPDAHVALAELTNSGEQLLASWPNTP
jgi:hypothetical protein